MSKVRIIRQDNPNFVVLEGYDGDTPVHRVSVSCSALAEGTVKLEDEVQALKDRMVQRSIRWAQAKIALDKLK